MSGYLSPNSYFDVYLELGNNKNIKISSLMKNTTNSTSKYLRKNVEYILDFEVEHLIKLDPEFIAEVSIYDNIGNNLVVNTENPTIEIKGNNFKVKSNNKNYDIFLWKTYEYILSS